MGPKKAKFKPPIRPKADGTGFVQVPTSDSSVAAPQRRGREGYSSVNNSSSLQASSNPVCVEQGKSSAELLLQLRSDNSLPSNEARLSPSSFKALGIVSGAVVRIKAGNTEAYAEAFLSSSCHSQVIILADEVTTIFNDKQVNVTLMSGPSTAVSLSLVTVEITSNAPGSIRTAQVSETVQPPFLQIRSVFRRQYQRRLVFQGMRAMVRIATNAFYVEVMQCVRSGSPKIDGEEEQVQEQEHVTLGILMDETVIRDGGREIHKESDVSEDAPGVEEGPGALENVLVVGEAGTGKSRFLQREGRDAATLYWRHVEVIKVEELSQGERSDVSSSTVLHEAFVRAKIAAPSTVLIDDLHLICGANTSTETGSLWATTLVASALCDELDDIRRRKLNVRVVASAPSAESVVRSLLTPERFGKRVELLTPGSAEERLECLSVCLEERGALGGVSVETLSSVAHEAHGFTQRDLARLVEVAMVENFRTTAGTGVTDASLLEAAKVVRPSALKQFEVSVPHVTWNDIGGSEAAKKTLQDCVAWCLGKQQWVFRAFKLSPPKGVLLYGPPGCSKTMLAKALANESKMNFISVKGPEVFSKWVGDSEKAVRDVFTRARAVAPCVVFIDELDGMCGHRGRGGVSDRVISQFLTELDGLPAALEESSEALVFVAATNRPDNIDTAVLRPGRIDRMVYVGLPDLAERRAIVRIHFAHIPVAPDIDADYVACRTDGYSGAEVVAVVKEAAFLRVTANARAEHITREDLDAALQKVKPRISSRDVEWYKRWSMGGNRSVR
ncbi:putative Transitional endoplasmic reticulum ATPase [Trypanosoma grayi]|uniref:putative Transitional endoplasmic reticulum ATPase n=1 Tax=Trypanosoma grayi TaxID=71804 RepID=UPI0004F48887|nr:putative Transitional endoplasmic reticulum ATPase [Trypanosoma grayi]KEG07550.1 putative Transitional endoplasmic reticulum ATPase [Trypanosoma grayi]